MNVTMDAAKKKALFRAKLNAHKKTKRIDSPLVRYNEFDQPICRICNVVLKSDSMWDAHQVSRKHHEAIACIRANASGSANLRSVKSESNTESPGYMHPNNTVLHDTKLESSITMAKSQASSVLPHEFFDNPKTKRSKIDSITSTIPVQARLINDSLAGDVDASSAINKGNEAVIIDQTRDFVQKPKEISGSETGSVPGILPEGFFENKEADLRAHGIKAVKPDTKQEYKEFEKLIRDDLQEVDDRLEEDEIDAAEMIEEAESLEQKIYRNKVELLKKKRMELMVSKPTNRKQDTMTKEIRSNGLLQDEDEEDKDEENFVVDWRAQHI